MSMNITSKPNISFRKNPAVEQNKSINGTTLPLTKRLNYSPATIGVMNGFCWFGVGMLMDKFFSKMMKSPANTKLSLAIQGAFGAFMGFNAYKVAKKEAAQYVKNA